MTERKRIKNELNLSNIKSLYERLKKMPNGDTSMNGKVEELLGALSNNSSPMVVCHAVKSLIELIRINQNANILSYSELLTLFNFLHEVLNLEVVDLSTLILLKVPALLKDKEVVMKFILLLSENDPHESKHKKFKLKEEIKHINIEYLKKIVIMFIEEGCIKMNKDILDIIVNYPDILQKAFNLTDFSYFNELPEDKYIDLFISNECLRTSKDIRIVKGKRRYEFLRAYVNSNTSIRDDIVQNYVNDKDERLRMLLAEKVSTGAFFLVLLNDGEEDVRLCLLRHVKGFYDKAIADRLLDKSYDVRKEALRIYLELLAKIKEMRNEYDLDAYQSVENKKNRLKKKEIEKLRILLEEISLTFVSDGKLRKSGTLDSFVEEIKPVKQHETRPEYDEIKNKMEIFRCFALKLFEGCMTTYKEEFVQPILDSGFSLFFYKKHLDNLGFSGFFEMVSKTYFKNYADLKSQAKLQIAGINSKDESANREKDDQNILYNDLVSFSLDYLFDGELEGNDILELIEDNIFSVLKFIKEPSKYFSLLLEKAKNIDDLESVEAIVQALKLDLSSCEPILPDENDEIVKSKPNFLFINAHTKYDQNLMRDYENFEKFASNCTNIYPYLYFIVHQFKSNLALTSKIVSALQACSTEQKIKLLIFLNKGDLLVDFADLLIKYNLGLKIQRFIFSKKNLVSTLIYFLSTGLVAVKSPSFFMKCIQICINSSSAEKVKFIFANYLKTLDQNVYDIFYSICWSLKSYSTVNLTNLNEPETAEDSLIVNPRILDDAVPQKTEDSVGLCVERNSLKLNSEIACMPDSQMKDTFLNTNLDILPPDKNAEPETTSVVNIVDENSISQSNKLKLSKKDKMLYSICNFVVNFRKGIFSDLNIDFHKFGFYKLSENHIEMILRGQVNYE